ncbi:rab-GTPase-TBC domain-containing protein [Baffinella frigidus]|nr:rab-GTPase-TBC domain-containing protein [Cryptophyta sp. CCMP2293]
MSATSLVGKREGSNRGAEWFTPKLRRVLLAYAQHNRSVGYCQSLNYLGGIVVVVVDAEEDCFWLLSAILEFLLPKTYYGDLSGVMLDVEALTALLERNLRAVKASTIGSPQEGARSKDAHHAPASGAAASTGGLAQAVKERLEMTHLPLTSFAAQWFMCAYVNVLSGASVIRVWDCLLMEGVVVLFRVALALLKAIEGELGMATEMEDAVAALQRARTLEIETVLQIAHSCFGSGVVDLSDLMQLRSQAIACAP